MCYCWKLAFHCQLSSYWWKDFRVTIKKIPSVQVLTLFLTYCIILYKLTFVLKCSCSSIKCYLLLFRILDKLNWVNACIILKTVILKPVVEHAFNLCTREVQAENLWVWGQPGFRASFRTAKAMNLPPSPPKKTKQWLWNFKINCCVLTPISDFIIWGGIGFAFVDFQVMVLIIRALVYICS